MTVIVCDAIEGVMAADTLITQSGIKIYHAAKIFRAKDGSLIGASGNYDSCNKLIRWAAGNRARQPAPGFFEDNSELVVMLPSRVILSYSSPQVETVIGDFHAIGCGATSALAARYLKACAADCVRAACHVHTECGGGPTILHLDI